MSNELTGTLDRVEQNPEGTTIAVISGADYVVRDYVRPYLDRQQPGDKVDIEWGLGKTSKDAGVKYLLKISPLGAKTKVAGKPAAGKAPTADKGRVAGILKSKSSTSHMMVLTQGKKDIQIFAPKVWNDIERLEIGAEIESFANNVGEVVRVAVIAGQAKKPPVVSGAEKEARNLDGIFRKSDGVNALITVGEKNSLYCLTPMIAEKIKEALPGQRVLFTIDQNSFLVRFALGEVLSPEEIAKLPPITLPVKTAAQIKKENGEKLAQNPPLTQKEATAPNGKKETAGEVEEIANLPKPCRFCEEMIIFKIVDSRARKFNLDGTLHSCDVDEGKTTAGQVQEEYGSTGPASEERARVTNPGSPTETPPCAAGNKMVAWGSKLAEKEVVEREMQQQTKKESTSPSPAASDQPYQLTPFQREYLILLQSCQKSVVELYTAAPVDSLISKRIEVVLSAAKKMARELMAEAIDRHIHRVLEGVPEPRIRTENKSEPDKSSSCRRSDRSEPDMSGVAYDTESEGSGAFGVF